jgi:hypothetical protein
MQLEAAHSSRVQVGGGMELFMIKTGFYDKCVKLGLDFLA